MALARTDVDGRGRRKHERRTSAASDDICFWRERRTRRRPVSCALESGRAASLERTKESLLPAQPPLLKALATAEKPLTIWQQLEQLEEENEESLRLYSMKR